MIRWTALPCNSIVKTSSVPPSFLRSSWTLLLCSGCSRRDCSGATWFSFSTYQQSDLTSRYHHLFTSRVNSILFENQVDGSGDLWWISVETDNKQSKMLKLRKINLNQLLSGKGGWLLGPRRIPGPRQRQKNLGSRVALLPGKFLRIRKVFVRRRGKNLLNCPNTFKTIQTFPDDFQFSGWFQSCPDFFRWLPIFRIISKLSGFSGWLPIFRMISKLSGFSRWLPNFRII